MIVDQTELVSQELEEVKPDASATELPGDQKPMEVTDGQKPAEPLSAEMNK